MWLSLIGVVGAVGSIWRTATAAWHVQHLFWHLSSLLCTFSLPTRELILSVFPIHSPSSPFPFPSPPALRPLQNKPQLPQDRHWQWDPLKAENPLATLLPLLCIWHIRAATLRVKSAKGVFLEKPPPPWYSKLDFPPSTNYEVKTSRQSASRWIEQGGGGGTRSDKDPAFEQNSKHQIKTIRSALCEKKCTGIAGLSNRTHMSAQTVILRSALDLSQRGRGGGWIVCFPSLPKKEKGKGWRLWMRSPLRTLGFDQKKLASVSFSPVIVSVLWSNQNTPNRIHKHFCANFSQ